MLPQFVKSLLVHGLALALLLVAGRSQSERIQSKQQQVFDDIRQQRELEREQAEEEEQKLAEEMLKDQLREEFEELVEDELDEEDEQELLSEINEDLEQNVEEALEETPLEELSADQRNELKNDLREETLDDSKLDLETLRKDAVFSEVRRYVHQQVAPSLKEQIEGELDRRTGPAIERALRESTDGQRRERLGSARSKIDSAREELRKLAGEQDRVRNEAEKKPEEAARRQTDAKSKHSEVAKQVDEALEHAARLGPELAGDVKKAKNAQKSDQIARHMQQAETALNSDDRDKGKREADAARGKLADAAGQLETLSEKIGQQQRSRDADAIQQATARQAMGPVAESVRQAVNREITDAAIPKVAERITGQVEDRLQRIGWNADDFSQDVQREIKLALDDAMGGADSPDSSTAMKRSEEAFADQDAGKADGDKAAVDAALGQQAASQAVEQAVESTTPGAVKSAADSVGRAASGLQIKGVISADGQSRFVRMQNLADEFTQVAKIMEQGRGAPTAMVSDGATGFQLGSNTGGADSSLSNDGTMVSGPDTGGAQSPLSSDGTMVGGPDTGGAQSPLSRGGAMIGGTDTGGGQSPLSRSGTMIGGPDTGGGQSPLSRSGTMLGGPDTGGMPDGISGNTQGQPAGLGDSHGARTGPGYNFYAQFNRDVYKQFKGMIEARKQETVGLESGEAEHTTLAASVAGPGDRRKPQSIFVESTSHQLVQQRSSTDSVDGRQVVQPRFEHLAFGAAEHQREPLKIDGDLSDWGTLRHPIAMLWSFNDEPLEDGLKLYLRWSPRGLYFCYRVPGRTEIAPPVSKPYEGDLLEVWLDVDNLRKSQMAESPFSQQFCLMPFGFNNDRNTTYAEVGRGFRGISRHAYHFDTETDAGKRLGWAAGRVDADGYTVEAFLSLRALAKPKLKAGTYVAMNFSINRGYDYALSQQWSMSKNTKTKGFDKPDTWGDVLLLGTDGEARFVNASEAGSLAKAIVPGEPVGIEITDEDMNVLPTVRERVLVQVKVKESPSYLYVILEETGPATGVFRGSFETQLPEVPPKPNTLNARGGDRMVLFYRDARAAFGEKDRAVEAEMELGLPMFKMQKGFRTAEN